MKGMKITKLINLESLPTRNLRPKRVKIRIREGEDDIPPTKMVDPDLMSLTAASAESQTFDLLDLGTSE